MSNQSQVSCVVPAYNSERFLGEALDSILDQTHRPLEIIVADDGSTDRTREIAAGYGDPVRVVTQETAGPPATRNLGLAAARGEFIAFLDADDLWHKQKLARQLERFANRPEMGACVTGIRNFWIPELKEEEARLGQTKMGQELPGYVTMTLLARRETFDAVGPFDVRLWYSDSADWFLRAREKGVVIERIDDVLVFHRMHENNLTRRQGLETRDEFLSTIHASLKKRRADAEKPANPDDAISSAPVE